MSSFMNWISQLLSGKREEQSQPDKETGWDKNGYAARHWCNTCHRPSPDKVCPVCGSDTADVRHRSNGTALYQVLDKVSPVTFPDGEQYTVFTLGRLYGHYSEIVTDWEKIDKPVADNKESGDD